MSTFLDLLRIKMWKIAYVCLWVGTACGLQPGFQYIYRYSGQIDSGIVENGHQLASAGIKGLLTLQVADDFTQIIAKLDDVEVGGYSGEDAANIRCRPPWSQRSRLEIPYRPLEHGAQWMMEPFKVNVENEVPINLEVSAEEPAWITNVRKSIVNIFPNFPLVKNIIEEILTNSTNSTSSTYDNWISGECKSRYSVMKKSNDEDHPVQRPTSMSQESDQPTIQNELWSVTRSVDFRSDWHLPFKSHIVWNDYQSKRDSISRMSNGQYLLRGDSNGIRMESATVDGSISVFPYEKNTQDHLDTFTSQSLRLLSVDKITSQVELSSTNHEFHSFRYFVDNTDGDGNIIHYGSLREIVTGIKRESDDEAQEVLFEILEELSDSPSDNLVTLMNKAVNIIKIFEEDQLEKIYKNFLESVGYTTAENTKQKTKSLKKVYRFKMAMVLAGTKPSMTLLLRIYGNKETRMEDDSIFFFFKRIPYDLKELSLIAWIMELTMSLSWDQSEYIAKTVGLTSFGSLVGNLCFFGRGGRYYPRDEISKTGFSCYYNDFESYFFPYVEKALKNTSTPLWQRAIYIQTAVNLASRYSIALLESIILGTSEKDVGLRTTAISGLNAQLLDSEFADQVFNLLQPLIMNQDEDDEVRSMAFLVLISWAPEESWWHQMAFMTWHDPSPQVVNFISSTIHKMATKQSQVSHLASRVLYLTKPVQATSLSYSSFVYLDQFLSNDLFESGTSVIWFANTKGIIPTHLLINYDPEISPSSSSFRQQISAYMKHLDVFLFIIDNYKQEFFYGLPTSERYRDLTMMVMELKMQLGVDIYTLFSGADLLLKEDFFYHFAQQLHVMGGRQIFGFIREIGRHLPKLPEIFHFNKGIDSTISIPTDLGLPLIVKFSDQSGALLRLERKSPSSDRISDIPKTFRSGSVTFHLQKSWEGSISAETLVPWINARVASGITSRSNVLLPFTVDGALYTDNKQAIIRIHPLEKDKVSMATSSNHPYTVLHNSLFPSIRDNDDVPHVMQTPGVSRFHEVQEKLSISSGVSLDSFWTGTIKPPVPITIIQNVFGFQSPTFDFWDYNLTLNKDSTSMLKYLTTVFSYVSKSNKEQDQSQLDAPFSISPQEEVEEEKNSKKYYLEDPEQEVITHQESALPNSDEVTSIGVRIISEEESLKKYIEVIASWATEESNTKLENNLKWKLNNVFSTHLGTDTIPFCVSMDSSSPKILPFTSVSEIVDMDLSSQLSISLDRCDGNSPLLEMKGSMNLSSETLRTLEDKLSRNVCDFDATFPVKDVVTTQLYDNGLLMINWRKDIPIHLVSLLWRTYDMTHRYYNIPTQDCEYQNQAIPPNEIKLQLNRDPNDLDWNVHSISPGKECKSQVTLPSYLEYPSTIFKAFEHHFLNDRNPGICSIRNDQVHTFDGMKYPFAPNVCWKIGAMSYTKTEFALQFRYTDHWEVKLIWDKRGYLFEINKDQIKVNGREPSDNHYFYKIIQKDNSILVILREGLAVKVSDKIEVQAPFLLKYEIGGLCGHYDNQQTSDMTGPSGCTYKDPVLFSAAWEILGDGCDASSHNERKQRVAEYRKNCTRTIKSMPH